MILLMLVFCLLNKDRFETDLVFLMVPIETGVNAHKFLEVPIGIKNRGALFPSMKKVSQSLPPSVMTPETLF